MTKWTSGSCESNGLSIHYLRTGGPKPPVVLLHGLSGNGACWSPLARGLEGHYDVVMPDARGHGNSDAPPKGYRYENHANDVVGLVEALGLPAPFLLGHSMGGVTAALVASRMPFALRGVVLADPTFLSPRRQREVHESDAAERHRRLLCLDGAEALAQARVRHPHRRPELLKLITEAKMMARIEAFEVLAPPQPDFRSMVCAIRIPILLVIGDNGVVSLETARELKHLNARLQVEEVKDAGHGLPYDQPFRFEEVVRSFLGSLTAT